MGIPLLLDGLFQGKSDLDMDDSWGYPHDLRNLHMENFY